MNATKLTINTRKSNCLSRNFSTKSLTENVYVSCNVNDHPIEIREKIEFLVSSFFDYRLKFDEYVKVIERKTVYSVGILAK